MSAQPGQTPQDLPCGEVVICSAIAFTRPECVDLVAHAIGRLAEVPRIDPRGRIIVLIEGASDAEVLTTLDRIRAQPDVITVQLVYQHAEPLSALGEST